MQISLAFVHIRKSYLRQNSWMRLSSTVVEDCPVFPLFRLLSNALQRSCLCFENINLCKPAYSHLQASGRIIRKKLAKLFFQCKEPKEKNK